MNFLEYYDKRRTLYRMNDLLGKLGVHVPRVGDRVSFADTREQYIVKSVNWYHHTGITTSNGELCSLEGVYVLVERAL